MNLAHETRSAYLFSLNYRQITKFYQHAHKLHASFPHEKLLVKFSALQWGTQAGKPLRPCNDSLTNCFQVCTSPHLYIETDGHESIVSGLHNSTPRPRGVTLF